MNDAADLVAADARARAAALDPTRSFIVQAPAGSGKTELLIQRYLRLLAKVDEPEEVVAMTFTRKAAGEMRERVLRALREAEGPPPDADHALATWNLARDLLAHSQQRGWELSSHAARLGIQTIDAWCMRLTRNAPLASGSGMITGVADDTSALFAAAARRLVFEQPMPESCRRLLAHLDNQADRLVALLAGMLAQRDQWLPWLIDVRAQLDRRSVVEANWRQVGDAILATAERTIPSALRERLVAMLRHARDNRILADPALEADWPVPRGWPRASCDDAAQWRQLAALLLTQQATLRKNVGIDIGFPAPSSAAGAEKLRRQRAKAEMAALLDALRALPGCAEAWEPVQRMPDFCYTDAQWTVVEALLEALPLAAAHLRLEFNANNVTDFTELALGALVVLGDAAAPSDVLLAYDQRVRHVLVDEFQDTSLTQFALLQRLTAGWSPGDGRTLFAVGDPMQSVYRFRGAEVGLFLDACHAGIGDVALEPLQLRVNFRSGGGMIEWVNRVFSRVLPDREVPDEGLTPFVSAVPPPAQRVPALQVPVTLHGVADEREQGRRVVELVRAAQAERPGDIAILVRTRNHLREVIPALREAGIAWQAVEIDPLATKQRIVDCLSLTHALLEPADRLAWLAVLRAPWCGLTLADLTTLVPADPRAVILPLLVRDETVRALTADGQQRLGRCAPILAEAARRVGRDGLHAAAEAAWLQLGGPATLRTSDDLVDVERYWRLLAAHADHPAFDWNAFVVAIDKLYGEPPPPPAPGARPLQIMTMHKAKGLQFGTVIAPGLAQPPGTSDPPLLRWRASRSGKGGRRLLIAPMQGPGERANSQYEYLRRRAASEERHELARLLYVTATRACDALHLIAVVPPVPAAQAASPFGLDDDGFAPRADSALGLLWDALGNEWPRPPAADDADATATGARELSQLLQRLPVGWAAPPLTDIAPAEPGPVSPVDTIDPSDQPLLFDWVQDTARAVGIVAHDYLRRIADDGAAAWPAVRIDRSAGSIRAALAEEGVPADELDDAHERVRLALCSTLGSARGSWVLDSRHGEAQSELALTVAEDSGVQRIVIDRTFVDAGGTRWIVDFKTSRHGGADLEAFLAREVERHRPQLERYARIFAALDDRAIRLGVYWPLHDAWREWPAGQELGSDASAHRV